MSQERKSIRDSLNSFFRKKRKKSESISGPSNVKRVMHITFDRHNQSFNGIPATWQNVFTHNTLERSSSLRSQEPNLPALSSQPGATQETNNDITQSLPVVTNTTSVIIEDNVTDDDRPPSPPPRLQDLSVDSMDRDIEEHQEQQVTEILSVVYDRDLGEFVNLPSHWKDRLDRNSLLYNEFEKDPDMIVKIFTLMDEELQVMFHDDEQKNSSLTPHSIVYEVQADKSASSSECDLTSDFTEDSKEDERDAQESFAKPNKGCRRQNSLVVVKAVQINKPTTSNSTVSSEPVMEVAEL